MPQTFLFYDIETTGLNKSFDQVLQFAAIRTDRQLNELERHEFLICLNPDVIPSPMAMITHHLSLKEINQGLNEFQAIKKIHALMNEPGTISVGYNTLGFDDEFLRFSFYRNLLAPYTHQWAKECGRMDLYPLAVMFFLFKPEVLQWPENFKLENINNLNHLAKGRAHHAMVDVEVTLELARKFFAAREMWDYLTGYFHKNTDQIRLQTLQTGLAIDGIFGAELKYQSAVLFLGNHAHYKNQSIWLRLDQKDLTVQPPENLFVVRKKCGEPSFIIPMRDKHLSDERKALIKNHEQWLTENPEKLAAIKNYHLHFKYPTYPDTDVDARLYLNGFLTAQDEKFCQQFHSADAKDKAAIVKRLPPSHIKTLATRILGRHFAEKTPSFQEYMQRVHPPNEEHALIDFRGKKRLTPKAALNEIAELHSKENLTGEQRSLLSELENYLRETFNEPLVSTPNP